MLSGLDESLAQMNWLLWILVIAIVFIVWVTVRGRKTGQTQTLPAGSAAPDRQATPAPHLEPDAIYQKGHLVARVAGAQVDETAKKVRFEELYNSDDLLLPDECGYRKYRILIQSVEFASKLEKGALHKGRVLRGVTADILGYVEQ